MALELCWPGGEKTERLGKKDLAHHIATYAAAKLEEMNMVGRWLATVSYPMARVTMGRHVWDLSRQFKLLSERLQELQGNLQHNYMTPHFQEALALSGWLDCTTPFSVMNRNSLPFTVKLPSQ